MANTALIRSCDGIPFDKSKYFENPVLFALQKVAIPTKSSTPHKDAITAMKRILINGCFTFLCLGSGIRQR